MLESLFNLVVRSANGVSRSSGPKTVKFGGATDEFFDDCPICQAQKAAMEQGRDMTMEEFMAAAAEVERTGQGVVGRF